MYKRNDKGELINEDGVAYGDVTKARVGQDATYRIGSDKYAGRIIAMSKTGHRVTWQRVNEDTGPQASFTREFTRRRDGTYMAIGSKHGDLVLGFALTALDMGF